MPTREESVRRMLESHPAAKAMTELERQELGDHLCDAVDAKVATGKTELVAAAEALSEMGDLGRIARAFPRGVTAATPEGILVAVSGWTVPAAAYLLLAGLWYAIVFVAPQAMAAARDADASLPAFVSFFLMAAANGGRGLFLLAAAPLVAAVFGPRFGRRASFQAACALVAAVALVLVLGGSVAAMMIGAWRP